MGASVIRRKLKTAGSNSLADRLSGPLINTKPEINKSRTNIRRIDVFESNNMRLFFGAVHAKTERFIGHVYFFIAWAFRSAGIFSMA